MDRAQERDPGARRDPLIRLNTDLPEAQFQMAEAQAKNNQTEFDRIKGLVDKGAAPSRDMDAAATQLAISKAQLEEARIRLARAHIVAPMTGVLNSVPDRSGRVRDGDAAHDRGRNRGHQRRQGGGRDPGAG